MQLSAIILAVFVLFASAMTASAGERLGGLLGGILGGGKDGKDGKGGTGGYY